MSTLGDNQFASQNKANLHHIVFCISIENVSIFAYEMFHCALQRLKTARDTIGLEEGKSDTGYPGLVCRHWNHSTPSCNRPPSLSVVTEACTNGTKIESLGGDLANAGRHQHHHNRRQVVRQKANTPGNNNKSSSSTLKIPVPPTSNLTLAASKLPSGILPI